MNNQLLVSVIIILASSTLGFSRTVGERDDDEYYSAAMAAAAAGDGSCYFKAKLQGCKKGTKLKIMTATEEDTEMPDVIIKSNGQTQVCLPAQCSSISGGTGKLSSSIEIGGEFARYSIEADPDMLTVKSAVDKKIKFYSTKRACHRSKATKVTISCTRTSTSSDQELEMEEFNADKLMNAAERNDDNTDAPDGMVMQEDDPDTPDGIVMQQDDPTDIPDDDDMIGAMMQQQQQQQQDDDDNLEDTKLEEEPTDDNDGDNNNDNSNEVELQGVEYEVTAKVQWRNWYHRTLYANCGNRAGIYKIRSYFSSRYSDRVWRVTCKKLTNRNFNRCYWTGYQNNYDKPLFAQCGRNYIMTGIYGVYSNSYHDRKFQLLCCRAPSHYTRNCYLSSFVNGWRGRLSYSAGWYKRVLTGAYSYHDNNQRDRLWKFTTCYYRR